jgi:glucose-6-phosphate 1-dehydrogenase
MRIRISPDVTIALGLRVKHPGEGMEGQDVELILTEQESAFMPPYQRLLGDAMHGIGDLLGRQDIVDAQRRIVEPVLDDVVLPVTYEQGSWGPEEANELIGPDGPWHNPKPAGLRP